MKDMQEGSSPKGGTTFVLPSGSKDRYAKIQNERYAKTQVRSFLAAWLLLGAVAMAGAARAQTPDSTDAAPADSLRGAAADSLRALDAPPGAADSLGTEAPPVGFADFSRGIVVGDSLPARRPALDATALLADVPGSFVYRFGAPGWPDAWSPYGLNPQRVALLLNGRPFSDLVTGRPRYDLLPLAFLERLRVEPERDGAPVAVGAEVRPYDFPQPFTELRYLAGSTLQSVDAMHVQQRRRPLFGRPGVLGLLGTYSGRGSDGAYPGDRGAFGTQLRRARRILGRIRYEQAAWSVELSNLYNRRTVGAFGGVVPNTFLYRPVAATLRNGEARRRTIRNDFALDVRARLLPGLALPLTASAYWTSQTLRYRDRADTLVARTSRYGFAVRQALVLGRHRLSFRVAGWWDRLRETNALAPAPRLFGRHLHAAVRDTFRLASTQMALDAGLHNESGRVFPAGSFRLDRRLGALRLFARGAYTGQPVSPVERYGYGGYVQPVGAVPRGRVAWSEAGVALHGGPFDLALSAFAHRASEALDLYALAEEADTVQALVSAEAHRRAGLIAEGGWRREAQRGFYLTVQTTLSRFLNPGASPEHARVAASLPEWFGQGRLGARYAPFQGDLDFDLYLLARFWSAMRSRTLHPPTGLLVLPPAGARVLGPSGTLDVFFETQVRTATIFLAYENALSGTPLVPGTLVVPIYPLPAQRFRFGVYWPITG